jgi:hypothetical protein
MHLIQNLPLFEILLELDLLKKIDTLFVTAHEIPIGD